MTMENNDQASNELLHFISQLPKTFGLLLGHPDIIEELDGVLEKEDLNLFREFISAMRKHVGKHKFECTPINGGFACRKIDE